LTYPLLLKNILLANKFLQGLYSNTFKRSWLLAHTSYVLTKLPSTHRVKIVTSFCVQLSCTQFTV